jgi:ferredoxin-type protein NapG
MDDKSITRREFFKQNLGHVVESVKEVVNAAWGDEHPHQSSETVLQLIRPPGALPEEEFLEKCTRCNECVKVCPEEAIMKFVGEGNVNHLTPMLSLRKTACVLCEDLPCIKVCESKALVFPESCLHVRMGTAVVNEKLCYAYQGSDCDYCLKECPEDIGAITFENRRPKVNADLCTGCGLCENVCPARQAAIVVQSGL